MEREQIELYVGRNCNPDFPYHIQGYTRMMGFRRLLDCSTVAQAVDHVALIRDKRPVDIIVPPTAIAVISGGEVGHE